MCGAASGLIEAFKAAAAAVTSTDWELITPNIYKYGGGGIAGWGSLCGVANGCGAVLNLFNLTSYGNEMMGHYSTTEFPSPKMRQLYDAGGWAPTHVPLVEGDVLAKTVSNSPLCHISISRWLTAAGVGYTDKDGHTTSLKQDRCGKMCADMAGWMAELINDHYGSGYSNTYSVPINFDDCLSCHNTGVGALKDEVGKMDCTMCHFPGQFHYVGTLMVEDVWTTDWSDNPQDTFSANDQIRYNVRFWTIGPGINFAKTRWAKAIIPTVSGGGTTTQPLGKRDPAIMQGGHVWSWDRNIPGDAVAGQAKINMRIMLRQELGGAVLGVELKKVVFTIV